MVAAPEGAIGQLLAPPVDEDAVECAIDLAHEEIVPQPKGDRFAIDVPNAIDGQRQGCQSARSYLADVEVVGFRDWRRYSTIAPP